jgi:hypothetical protein
MRRQRRNALNPVSSRTPLTRRNLLAAALAVGATPVLAAKAEPSNPIKAPKDRVHYSEMASDAQKTCKSCKLFRQPGSCLFVAGEIAPHCSCMLWAAPTAA